MYNLSQVIASDGCFENFIGMHACINMFPSLFEEKQQIKWLPSKNPKKAIWENNAVELPDTGVLTFIVVDSQHSIRNLF